MALPLSLDDKQTLQAIGILADALDDVSGAGVLDTVLVSKALRQVLATKSRPAFDFASRAFSTLDPDVKRQVAVDANAKAKDYVGGKPEEPLPMGVRRAAVAAPTGILSALNARGRPPRRGGPSGA
ncbi:MAG: hypothetical protein WCF85_08370 [Rhodospirillaceae bacterium]